MKKSIIIGGGAAGLSAAAEAAELGKHVIVIEENPKLGGNGLFAEVMFALNSREQEKHGIKCDLDGYFSLAMEHSHWKNNARLVRRLLEESGANMNWLLSHGLIIEGFQHEGAPGLGSATHYSAGSHTGADAMRILIDYCQKSDYIEIMTRTRVTDIMKDSSGNVIGVIADNNGELLTINADSVLICCGGCLGNPELIQKLIPGIDASAFAHARGIKMKGSGILLAQAAKAKICNDGCFENAGPTFQGDSRLMTLVTKRYAIWLNKQGRRFANEEIGDNFVFGCNAVYAQPGHKCVVLLDADMVEEAINGPVDFLAGPEAVAKGTSGIMAAIFKEMNTGRVCYSENLEQIANWMGIKAAVLHEELELYNKYCEIGKDAMMLKSNSLLKYIKKPPFLAIECGIDNILTHGGILVNENMQVLRDDGSVIPSLYAAGADISGVDANGYQVSLPGHSLGFSMTGGRIAAKYL